MIEFLDCAFNSVRESLAKEPAVGRLRNMERELGRGGEEVVGIDGSLKMNDYGCELCFRALWECGKHAMISNLTFEGVRSSGVDEKFLQLVISLVEL